MDKIKELQKMIHDFSEKRNWNHPNLSKDLALSISLEASELLECFQWISGEQAMVENLEEIKDEIADVLIYCFRFIELNQLDFETLILNKLAKNAIKYPVK